MDVRDLRNVRVMGAADETAAVSTPLTPDEERRAHATLFTELGNALADRGWTTFPAYSPAERLRLVRVGEALAAHWGIPVRVEPVGPGRMRLSLAGYERGPAGERRVG
ncbi:hypothetical protein ACIO3O_03720 [Streptomyces sp. NPDC087440]|uniref:hypothetical protein n=1 Tax=Streptomyces sp. NPDC087440 TaxID=3365790 RepID=UPI0037F944B0